MPLNPKDQVDAPSGPTVPGNASDRLPLERGLYLAAAFGGFLVGFGELIRAGSDTTNVTVLRISAVLREQFSPALGGGWIALCLLAIFSTILCGIYRPVSRKEAFALGLSVFAILAAFTPQQQLHSPLAINQPQLGFFSIMSQVMASPLKSGEVGDYYFEFTDQQNRPQQKLGLMSVFDNSEKHLLLTKPLDTTKISKLRLPKGFYVLKLECGGCASVRIQLYVDKSAEASLIRLGSSSIPLSFQRLFNADTMEITDLPDTELDRIEKAYLAQQ